MKEEENQDFTVFLLVADDTDHLPIGSVRQYWAPDVLPEKDREIREVEEFYRADVIKAATNIYRKYNKYVEELRADRS